MFKIIVAACRNSGIGYKNKIPWYLPLDMKNFKKLTVGEGNNAVVMGKNTWLSMPLKSRPLPKRDNIVLTRRDTITSSSVTQPLVMNSVEAIKDLCREKQYKDVWIIGGSEIYKLFLDEDLVSEIWLTQIANKYKCDKFFPIIPAHFRLMREDPICIENNITFNFKEYTKFTSPKDYIDSGDFRLGNLNKDSTTYNPGLGTENNKTKFGKNLFFPKYGNSVYEW